MKFVRHAIVAVALAAAGAATTSRTLAGDLLVFAAASTKNAAEQIGAAYVARGGDEVAFSFASSSDLAKQIENGAPAALYISADTKWMDYLAARNLLAPDSRLDLLGNRLVLIAPKESGWALALVPGADLAGGLGDGKLAMADPDHVPAGRYGKESLETLAIWSQVEPAVVRTKDVRAALALVERGEAAAGIVYATDAAIADKVRTVAEFPADSHDPIVYPVAIVAGRDDDAARRFYDFIRGAEARELFLAHGFTVNASSVPTN